MKQSYSFIWLLLPIVVLIVLGTSIMYERSGMKYEISYPPMQMLPQAKVEVANYFENKPVEALVLFDSQGFAGLEHKETVLATLDSMQVKYDVVDINSGIKYDLNFYKTVVVAFLEIDKLDTNIFALINWVEDGGRLLFSIRPEPSSTFDSIYRKLGITSKADYFVSALGVEFITELLPGAKGLKIGQDFIFHNSYPVELEEKCVVHLISADEFKTPILWECEYGIGRFVVINSDQFNTKSDRGIIGSSYSLLQDVFVYPVINSSVFFIDDFPSPIPQGSDEQITEEFGRDLQSFFVNVWWPDIHQIAREYNIKFTGVMIETYNDTVIPPFGKQPDLEKHKYFGGLVLDNGGEIGLHGYNHVPLCTQDSGVNQTLDYPGWSSQESMELAVFELFSFSKSLFPDNKFRIYVPPSNVLCPEARQWLPQVLPELQVIASVYLPLEGGVAYVQEFEEAPDGVIEFPRIVAGYELDSYFRWAALNELGLHYINSHFAHPDDVLSEGRGSKKGWNYLKDRFHDYVKWLSEAAPGLRNTTAIEGAMAVQRYSRLAVKTESQNGVLEITLGNFYDEAWLMLRSVEEPKMIEGGELTQVADDLYLLQALSPNISVQIKE